MSLGAAGATPLGYSPTGASFETDAFALTNSRNRGFDAPHGPVTSTSPEASNQVPWATYFGLPKKEVPQDPYLSLGRENYDLPEGYKGSVLYLDLLIIYQIRLSQMYAITRLLPLKRWDKSMTISWNVWQFDQGRLGRTPEESMSRLLTSSFNTGQATFNRWGLAFMLEHGFMNTPRGRMNYRYNLVQIANATIETLCYGVIIALLSCSPMSFLSSQSMKSISNDQQRWQLFQEEIDQWACVHKSENPLMNLWNKLNRKILTRTGEEADVFFVPYGTRGKVNRPEEAYFFLSGKQNDYNRGTQMPGVSIFESRDYKVGEGKDEDPAWQERTVGQHAYMLDKHLAGIKLCDFRTDMMDIALFSEKDDAFKRLSYKYMVQTNGMFKDNLRTGKWDLTELGLAFFEDNTTVGDYLASVGKLDTWANQLATCDHQRLLNFLRTFATPGESGPFKSRYADEDDHDGQGRNLGRNPDPNVLTTRGVEVMKYLFNTYRGAPGPQAARPAANRSRSRSRSRSPPPARNVGPTPKEVFNTAMATLRPLNDDANAARATALPAVIWAYNWATYQLYRCLTEGRFSAALTARVAAEVSALTRNPADVSSYASIKRHLDNIWEDIAQVDEEGSPANMTYALLVTKVDARSPVKPADVLLSHRRQLKGAIPFSAAAIQSNPNGQTVKDRIYSLFNATEMWAGQNDEKSLDVAAGAAFDALAQVKAVAPTLFPGGAGIQPAAFAFTQLIASWPGGATKDDIVRSCKRFASTDDPASAYKKSWTVLENAQVAGRFQADQKAEEHDREEKGDESEPPVDMREAKNHIDIYKRTPAIRTLLGDDNMFLLYHRMVLAQPRPGKHSTITREQFIYYLSLVESMYEEDLQAAKGTGIDRERHERNAELRVIYLLQESAYQRMFKLRPFLGIEQNQAMWNGGLSVSTFLTQAVALRVRVRSAQNALLEALKTVSENFLEAWHKKLPKSVRDELANVNSVDDLVTRGSNVGELYEALKNANDADTQKDPSSDTKGFAMIDALAKGSIKSVSPDYIKELLRNMPLVDGDWVRWGLENDMWPVIGIFVLKPYGTWVMGQAFAMQGGGKVGYTFEGHHDFQLQDNAVRKMHVGHWTLYAKPVVIRAEGVAHAFNIVANGYVGGNDDDVWDIHNSNHVADYNEGKYFTASIFAVPVRINRPVPHWVYDITNRFNRYLGTTPEVCKERSLELWAAAWNWTQDSSNPMERPIIPHDDSSGQRNTIVFSANMLIYDHRTGEVDRFVRGRGHWGEREVSFGCLCFASHVCVFVSVRRMWSCSSWRCWLLAASQGRDFHCRYHHVRERK